MFNVKTLQERLEYRDGELYWRTNQRRELVGMRAGCEAEHGYRKLWIGGRQWYEHRVIWAMFNGGQVPDMLDHINRNKSDNRIENLRPSDHVHNATNTDLLKTNKTGVKGVSKRGDKWRARYSKGKERIYLGMFNSIEDAELAIKQHQERQ